MTRARFLAGTGMAMVLSGCGSAGTPPTAPATVPAITSAAATMPSVERVAAVRERLLTDRDIGEGYTAGEPYSNRDPDPGPCGKPTMQARYPAYRDVEVHLDSEEGQIAEHVMVYAQAATARHA